MSFTEAVTSSCRFGLALIWSLLKSILLMLKPSFLDIRKNIEGQIALVTGGGNGLGRELSLRLSELGAVVVIVDVDAGAADVTRKQIEAKSRQAYVYLCDVSDRQEVYKMAKLVKQQVGKVDILVNNAGVALAKTFDKLSDEAIEKVYGINILSHYWTCKAFLPDMVQEDKGHVLAVASVAGFICGPSMCEYSPTKHAVMALMECLRAEVILKGVRGVQMTTACPFFMKTQLFTADSNKWMPYIDTRASAHTIVDGMLRNKDVVVLPSFLSFLRGFKILGSPSVVAETLMMGGSLSQLSSFRTKGVSHVQAYNAAFAHAKLLN